MSDLISRQGVIDKDTNVPSTDCISRQEAIDAVYYAHGTGMALKAIKQLPAAQPSLDEWCDDCKEYDKEKHCCPRWNRVIRQTAEDMKAAQTHWIPVTERLPEEDGTYIVCLTDGSVFEYDYLARWAEKWTYVGKEVTAWMPLPEP